MTEDPKAVAVIADQQKTIAALRSELATAETLRKSANAEIARMAAELETAKRASAIFETGSAECAEVFDVLYTVGRIPATKPGPRLAVIVAGVLAELETARAVAERMESAARSAVGRMERAEGATKELRAELETARADLQLAAEGFRATTQTIRAVAFEEAKNAFRPLRATSPEAAGTDWDTIARELTDLTASDPTLCVVVTAKLEALRSAMHTTDEAVHNAARDLLEAR